MKLEAWQHDVAASDKSMWRMSWKTRKLWPVMSRDQHAGSMMEVDRPKNEKGEIDYKADGVCADCGSTVPGFNLEESIVIFNKYRLGWLVCRDCGRKERAIRHSYNRRAQRAAFIAKQKGKTNE